jgi:hypothetical protein
MEYLRGYSIKPKDITPLGTVIFTDGTNDVSANQLTCEAYGYTYNASTGLCEAFRHNPNLNRDFSNTSNTFKGEGNVTERGTNNALLSGSQNTTKGENTNVLITGKSNEISSGLDNTSVIGGTYANALRQSEVIIGGGEALGRNQSSTVQLAGTTENATATSLTVQGDGSSYMAVQNNSIFAFEVKLIVLCSGGSSGTAGDYAYLELKGAVQVDDGYNLTFSQSSTTIASVGSTGTAELAGVTDPYITVEVTGAANRNLEWFASVKITEKKLSTDTF